jgi:phosphohistidine phosphatase
MPVDHVVRYLWILRHAKASADAPSGGSDMRRPLAERGRRDATALGRRLAAGEGVFGLEGVPIPEVMLCSSAIRTNQTAQLVRRELGATQPLELYRSLYGATAETALRYVREIDDGARSALLVGHNPTVYQLAFDLVGPVPGAGEPDPAESADLDRLRNHGFPTCALAVVALPVDSWEEVAEGRGWLAGVFSPPY